MRKQNIFFIILNKKFEINKSKFINTPCIINVKFKIKLNLMNLSFRFCYNKI